VWRRIGGRNGWAAYVSNYASLHPVQACPYKALCFSPDLHPTLNPFVSNVSHPLSLWFLAHPICSAQPVFTPQVTMAAKKRCQSQIGTEAQCNSAALRIVGECPHCRAQFCGAVSNYHPSCGLGLMHIAPFYSASTPGAPQLLESGGLPTAGL